MQCPPDEKGLVAAEGVDGCTGVVPISHISYLPPDTGLLRLIQRLTPKVGPLQYLTTIHLPPTPCHSDAYFSPCMLPHMPRSVARPGSHDLMTSPTG